jgi:hypothetical protein
MALKEDAKYDFSVCFVRVTPLNDDLTIPEASNIIGAVGPYDFSNTVAVISAVPFISKIDSGAEETVTVDLSGVADNSAVTVAELFAAINLAAPTDVTASEEAGTGRLKLVFASGTVVQAYGECNTLAGIGQGKGVRVISSNTMQSFTDNPNLKDEETFTTTDGKGIDTEVVTDGYRKGVAGVLTDTAMDYLMRMIIEGGDYDEVNLVYSAPTVLDQKIYFKLEIFSARYLVGTNKEADIDGYIQEVIYSCKGSFGDRTKERGFVNAVYNYTATSDKSTGVVTSDTEEYELTVSEFDALDLENISA